MSNKALRHFLENSSLDSKTPNAAKTAEAEDEESEEDEMPVMAASKKKNKRGKKKGNNRFNMFDLLNENDAATVEEDEADKSDQDENQGETELVASGGDKFDAKPAAQMTTKAKKKRKKKAKSNASEDGAKALSDPAGDVEASIQEVNHLLGIPVDEGADEIDSKTNQKGSPLLTIDYRNLNPENELKRIFGAQVVRGERPNFRGRRKPPGIRRSWKLVQPKEGWHNPAGSGLSMTVLSEDEGFVFVHSATYQETQHLYHMAVQSGNPENIFTILRNNPYHIDTLIQLAEFYRMNEDHRTAAECIEKALFGMESAFDVMFNLAKGVCLMEYKRQENRALHICLFKHILNIGNRGCYRTAFEFCKLLLRLDRRVDPLSTMYLIDFYALRAGQYEFLIRLWRETSESNSSVLERVNFALSVPLALYHTAITKKTDTKEADELLQDRLLMYPVVLKPLLDKCSVQPDKIVDSHPFFNSNEIHNDKSELGRIVKMVVERIYPCWKEPDVMAWLERNVQEVLKVVDNGQDPRINLYATMREARFKGASPSLLRHYLLCEISGLGMPRSVHNLDSSQLTVTDPFPPSDSISSYKVTRDRPRETRGRRGDQSRQNMLGLLLESLLPTYDQNAPPEENVLGEGDAAEGGAYGFVHPLHNGANAIMDAMRALLTDLRGPDDVPNAPNGMADMLGDDEVNDEEWEDGPEEFD